MGLSKDLTESEEKTRLQLIIELGSPPSWEDISKFRDGLVWELDAERVNLEFAKPGTHTYEEITNHISKLEHDLRMHDADAAKDEALTKIANSENPIYTWLLWVSVVLFMALLYFRCYFCKHSW